MCSWTIEKYRKQDLHVWDNFVRSSRNGTFLFERGYMDYHADRFADYSLMAYKDGKLRALLPANIADESRLCSHGGLTYGGWITPMMHFDANDMLQLFDVWLEWCLKQGIKVIDYKTMPWIYGKIPAQEDEYALFRNGAVLTESNLSSAILLSEVRPFNTQQKRNLKRGEKSGASVVANVEAARFHKLLAECLAERHGVRPVHTADELELLRGRFPGQIKFFGTENGDVLTAGVCMFETDTVAHCQYIASTPEGRERGELTLLFSRLIEMYKETGIRYFDFGISNEDHGKVLNEGLLRQKSSLGGSGVAYNRYKIITGR